MQAEVAGDRPRARARAASGPTAWASSTSTANSATYIGDVSPYLPRGGVAGIAQSGSVTRRVRPFRLADRLLADHQLRLGGRPRRLRLPGLLPRRPGDELGHPVPRGVQAARAVPGPGRPRARAGQADHGRQGRPQRPGAGRGRGPHGLARGRGPGHRRGARRGRASSAAATSTSCSRRAELVEGIRRTGRRVGRGRTGVVTVSTGEALAHRGPRAADRARPAADPRARPGPRSSRRCRRWATSATRSIRGAPPTRRRPTARRSRRWPARAPTTSSCWSMTSRTARCRPRSPPPTRSRQLLAATRRPAGDPAGLRLAHLGRAAARDQGAARHGRRRGAAAARRGRGVPGDRRSAALGGAARAPAEPPVRGGGWPALAADRTSFGAGRARRSDRGRRPRPPVATLSERESLALLGAAGIAVDRGGRRRRRGRRGRGRAPASAARSRSSSTRSGSPTRATSAASRSACAATTRSAAPRRALLEVGRQRGLDVRGLLVEPMAAPGRRAHRRHAARPAVRPGRAGRARRDPDRGPRRRGDPARAARRGGRRRDARRAARGAAPGRRARPAGGRPGGRGRR